MSAGGGRGPSSRRRLPGPSPEAVREWLANSCAAQGVAVTVTDPVVLGKVAVLLGSGREPVEGSGSPGRFHSGRVKPGVPAVGRVDGDPLDQGFNYGPLAGEGEAGPLAS